MVTNLPLTPAMIAERSPLMAFSLLSGKMAVPPMMVCRSPETARPPSMLAWLGPKKLIVLSDATCAKMSTTWRSQAVTAPAAAPRRSRPDPASWPVGLPPWPPI